MDEQRDLFADGIGEITLAGGMVRMDLVTLTGTQKENEHQPQLKTVQRVVMPPDGFLRSYSAMEDLVKQLVDAGVIQKREQVSAGSNGESAAAPTSETKEPPKSPNF